MFDFHDGGGSLKKRLPGFIGGQGPASSSYMHPEERAGQQQMLIVINFYARLSAPERGLQLPRFTGDLLDQCAIRLQGAGRQNI